MSLSAAEQYMLELVNRARLDPVGEAARYGISLNQGLTPGRLGTQVRQPLAANPLLEDAAIGHSKWMLTADVFSHTGSGGSSAFQRAESAGYFGSMVGENISWRGTTGRIDANAMIDLQHSDLFRSASHRINILYDNYREVGISQELGVFTSGRNFNASMITQDFGTINNRYFLTGVAYTDTNKNNFYSIGEGRAGVTLTVGDNTAITEAAGGYALEVGTGSALAVSGKVGMLEFTATIAANSGNVKLDVVNGDTFFSSASLTLGTGINHARLLGAAALDATGNEAANLLTGNAAANVLSGAGGNDTISGAAGADQLLGGSGNDSLSGDAGADVLRGGIGNDTLLGGTEADKLYGDEGNDKLTGGLGADAFYFIANGDADTVTDFNRSQGDRLVLDDALWEGRALTAAQVVTQFAHRVGNNMVFDFGDGDTITLTGINRTTGLAGQIDII